MRPSRVHRLPQRLDYILIPPPLNLSIDTLPMITEKSPLPAVIVTPSSPSSSHDFSIAFLPPTKEPSFKERLGFYYVTHMHKNCRIIIILLILTFVLLCHVVAHQLTMWRPHLDFSASQGRSGLPFPGWFHLKSFMGTVVDKKA